MFWYCIRAGLELNRGPWENHVEYLRSIPIEPDFLHNDVGLGVQQPEQYLKLLELYKSLTPHLLPKDPDRPFNQPVLCHPDLTPGNIFHTIIQPQFLAAGYPYPFENPNEKIPLNLNEPKLPENFESLPAEEQAASRDLHRRRLLLFIYYIFKGHPNQPHLTALQDPLLLGRRMLVDRAGRQWEGNLVTLKGALVRTAQFWEHLPDVDESTTMSNEFTETEDTWLKMTFAVDFWRQRVCNMTEEGWVRNEDYDEVKKKLEDLKEEIWMQCAGDEEDEFAFRTGWPFRDREEID
ncbi:hypothetical protein K458DRAFT_447727 [Lentithecium fluviatile CBS 122367]|uniref:Aminoglycoside phosphotransferase domain-containing protein n=1 Tax=Lentithecium fluviatile CBS 122367 TaxID=1168545 RepID=A0A6G1ID28_9PLEO|nr:hypothetical protein K458DRAFT_447727 [Lentithecium fluviatile CBS 122367]